MNTRGYKKISGSSGRLPRPIVIENVSSKFALHQLKIPNSNSGHEDENMWKLKVGALERGQNSQSSSTGKIVLRIPPGRPEAEQGWVAGWAPQIWDLEMVIFL